LYRLVREDSFLDEVAHLPAEALLGLQETLLAIQLTPWNGKPQHRDNPDGAVRRWLFGPGLAGQVVYLILEDQREVHLLLVQWVG
jgi:hypothetical protein